MFLWPLLLLVLFTAVILYTLIGYPLALAVAAKRRNRGVNKVAGQKTVSVLLPVHNGEKWIAAKLETLIALDYPRHLVEIHVLSDGSTDATASIARQYASHGVHVHELPWGGKAAALNAGLKVATGEVLLLTDVRQRLDPDSLRELVACLGDEEVGVASGELIILDGSTGAEANIGLYWKYEKWIRRRQAQVDSIMGATGAIYAMRRTLAEPLPPGTLNDDMHLPLVAFLKGYRIVFEQCARAYDIPTGLETEFRRKVRTLAGVYQIVSALPSLLGPRNRMWWHFVSHKIMRMLMPFALIGTACVTPFLPAPLSWLIGLAQALFYAAVLLDPIVPERSLLKRITSPARTFTVMMAATFCAVSYFFVPADKLWAPRKR